MIKKLRRNFIALAVFTLMMAMGIVLGIVTWMAAHQLTQQYEVLLDWMLEYNGKLPEVMDDLDEDERKNLLVIPEIIYETRYFSVEMDEEHNVQDMHLSFIHSVNREKATALAQEAMKSRYRHGWIYDHGSQYLFKWQAQEDGTILLVFIDATSRLWILTAVMRYMMIMAGIVIFVYFFLYTWYSRRIVQPYIEAQQQQKRFITNASHELKTPLTVIAANTEMIEAKNGESKWTQSTLRQIERMNGLIRELVTLSRLDEKEKVELAKVDWSHICVEETDAFAEVAHNAGLEYEPQIAPGISVKGEEKALRELATILLDNAMKYCDREGKVAVTLTTERHGAVFTVSNSYAAGKDTDYTRFFERFYRADESHNSQKSGYGIGLSIAKQIAEILGGRLDVDWKDGVISFSVTLKVI